MTTGLLRQQEVESGAAQFHPSEGNPSRKTSQQEPYRFLHETLDWQRRFVWYARSGISVGVIATALVFTGVTCLGILLANHPNKEKI